MERFEGYVMDGCVKLTTFIINAVEPPTFGDGVFRNCAALTEIKVPRRSVQKYKDANGWRNYASKIVAID